jgi:hypothetical protein
MRERFSGQSGFFICLRIIGGQCQSGALALTADDLALGRGIFSQGL